MILGKLSDSDLYQALGSDLHGLSAHHIVFVDGVYDEENSFIIGDEAGLVHMTSLQGNAGKSARMVQTEF